MKQKFSAPFVLMAVLFNVCLIMANMFNTKLIHVFGDFSVSAGLLIFPISYIINDAIVEVYGFKKAKLIIWLGFSMNFMTVGIGFLATLFPSPEHWQGAEHFDFVFGLAPRIVVASLIAFLVGSFLNAYVMSKMKIASKGKNFSARAIISTIVGEAGDSVIFFPIAFGGLIPVSSVLHLILIQVILKTLYEIIVLPLTIIVVKKVKEIEGIDTFDDDISYNIWSFKDI